MKNKFVAGDHNVISDISGQKFKRSECCFNWKGQLVHRLTEFEPKHPQLTIRSRKEQISVTDGTRTQGDDSDLQDPSITLAQMI